MKTVASCYEIRQVWGFGCPNPGCPNAATSPPVPCRHWASVMQPACGSGRPLPPDDAVIESPAGYTIEPGKQPKRTRKAR